MELEKREVAEEAPAAGDSLGVANMVGFLAATTGVIGFLTLCAVVHRHPAMRSTWLGKGYFILMFISCILWLVFGVMYSVAPTIMYSASVLLAVVLFTAVSWVRRVRQARPARTHL